ncbi:hypothetical protein K474DRAFT_1394216 [Panus rudis PR-1116 ss-1]|nr:hypothetical protein K474DRAFT_1394216 [Panus rudis PR-1116 ss-1]
MVVWLAFTLASSAYRFPTESCPGFYGFAFPSGLNRTKSQAFQKPASTPSQSAQCLSFSKPTSTPTVTRGVPPGSPTGLYAVYGQDGMQVPLKGTEFLAKGISKVTG